MTHVRIISGVSAIGLAILLVAAAPARQETENQAPDQEKAQSKGMSCPMMAGLKGLELYPDSPVLLLARADELGLTKDQQKRLQEAAEAARRQAREVLDNDQRKKIADAPEGPLSPMQFAMMRMKSKTEGKQGGMMCPMCMKMMHEKMLGDDTGHEHDAKGEHDHAPSAGKRSEQ